MRKKLATICLLLSSFFLPFGYDALFKLIMDMTSYWVADFIFYVISSLFFITYLFLVGVPQKWYTKIHAKIYSKQKRDEDMERNIS